MGNLVKSNFRLLPSSKFAWIVDSEEEYYNYRYSIVVHQCKAHDHRPCFESVDDSC